MTHSRMFAAVAALALYFPAFAAEDTAWTETLDRISTGVVSIRVDSTRAFDTEWNTSSQATGFVVDAERGLILTNRHVVTPGEQRRVTHIGKRNGAPHGTPLGATIAHAERLDDDRRARRAHASFAFERAVARMRFELRLDREW